MNKPVFGFDGELYLHDPDGKPDESYVDYFANEIIDEIRRYERDFVGNDFMYDMILAHQCSRNWLDGGYTRRQVYDMAKVWKASLRARRGKFRYGLRVKHWAMRVCNRAKQLRGVKLGISV